MSIMTPPTWNQFQQPPFPVRRFTVAEYHQMIQAGLLKEGDPVELLEGWLVPKMVRNTPHDLAIEWTEEAIRSVWPTGWRLRVQSAITLADSEPEPDVAVVRGSNRPPPAHHPSPPDIALVVEVADSSLAQDRNDKGRVYARADIPVYWIINLVDVQVEVYTAPSGPTAAPAYGQRQDYRPGDHLPLILAGQQVGQIAAQDLLP